ncbi:VCBS repeat-containing protein [Terrimonas pollutisoli]|uniref:VCBS repeat-containing protein n=1 Tax=Terrimonas pollutisoli TaxID=3034147 RepID=UPI0023EC28E9|nr:VCBS repeat-containing protein [Terrimonas sp. H1YJ31]
MGKIIFSRYKSWLFILFAVSIFYSCKNKKIFFESLSSSHTNINFTNTLEKHKLFNILYYLYYYNGGGVAVGDINNDGLADIYFTANNKGGNKLYLNKGNFAFEDITDKAGVAGFSDWCTGVTMADVNGDGFLDIYVSTVSNKYGLNGHNELYINNRNGTFSEQSQAFGLNTSCFTTQSAFFDYDRDGDLDCYILNQSHHPHANIVDTNNRKKYDSLSGDRLYRNDLNSPTKKFTDVSVQAGIYQSNLGYGLGLAVADINNDGWDDIYIGNDFHENDYYYVNNGNGTFSESSAKHFRHYSRFSMGNDVADYNNDGQLDIVTVDMLPPDEKVLKTYGSDENPDVYKVKLEIQGYQKQYSKNCLQRNNGNGESFSELSLMSGVSATDWSWSSLFADFDNDSKKDLFVTSGIVKRPVDLDYVRFVSDMEAKRGLSRTDKYDEEVISKMPDGSSHPFLFKANDSYSFTDVSKEWGLEKMKGYFNGAAYGDLDNDGDLDMVINCIDASAVILKNNTPVKNQVSISFKGNGMNTSGIGAKAYVFTKGKLQYQQLMLTRGFQSSCDTRLHFGLDSISTIDSILIVWGDQKYQVLKNIPANKQIAVAQKDALGIFEYAKFFPVESTLFDDVSRNVECDWKHRENDFIDFNVQYLIPHQQSTRGPKMAVADVNGDGLDDFYVCGAKFQPGALMIQQATGGFKQSDSAVFAVNAISEDVDATFFDANGDGFVDLWVVSGGNESPADEYALEDRLYFNDGKGHFTKAGKKFTQKYENKSCIAVADIDKDGDIDVFIGNSCKTPVYGLPQPSFFYINDGKANFASDYDQIMKLSSLGMVTAASFADVNNDSWPDLIVTGEWMPVKIFINNKGKFTAMDIPASTGLWQSLYTTDVNGDGLVDILAGNWGHNSKLYAGKNGPLKLYVKDFDNNGTIEQVMAYTVNGEEYTFLAKDELERALPVLKKAYLKYEEVAGKTVQYMFYDLFKDYTELKAEVLSSSCFINDGKGNFIRQDLPSELQLAPVMAFAPALAKNQFIGGGNFYGVIPYEGRYDALLPTQFGINESQHKHLLANLEGEIRDIKWIRTGNGKKILALARNNQGIVFLKPNN